MITKDELASPHKPTWCPGCGDFGIWLALKNALTQLDLKHEEVVIAYGIGCCSNMCNTLTCYGLECLHGRPIPVAEGVKMANPRLKVIVVAGDGDTFGEGLNHFIAGLRANHDVTLIVHDNRVYGLTTGQTSPTSGKGYKSKSTPQGVIEVPIKPMALAVAAGATWAARGFSANPLQLTALIKEAIGHRGFSVVDVLQNCATFNKVNDVTWFKEHTYDAEHDVTDPTQALTVALDEERLATGVIFRSDRESYDEGLTADRERPIVDHDISDVDISESVAQFM